jgi:hypothetical protein
LYFFWWYGVWYGIVWYGTTHVCNAFGEEGGKIQDLEYCNLWKEKGKK